LTGNIYNEIEQSSSSTTLVVLTGILVGLKLVELALNIYQMHRRGLKKRYGQPQPQPERI